MNIAYATTCNALDIHNWPGLGHTIANTLEEQCHSTGYIDNRKKKVNLIRLIKTTQKFLLTYYIDNSTLEKS